MPKDKADEVQSTASAQQLNMTAEMLQQLISAAVTAAVAEAKKPYVDEEEKARKERERDIVRREEQQRIANKKAAQDNCPHVDPYENYAFVGQRNCMGQVVFICSQCCKPFAPGDPEYNQYVRYLKHDRLGAARTV